MNHAVLVLLIVAGAALLLVGVWCGVITLIARLGGWRRLAMHYAATQPPTGTRYRFRSGRLGLANYGNCLTIHTSAEGVHLAVLWLFGIGHPPLFIPWSELHDPRVRWNMVAFEVGRPRVTTLQLPRAIIAEHMAGTGDG